MVDQKAMKVVEFGKEDINVFFILFSQNNSFLAILKCQPLLQVLHFFHPIFKKRLALSVPLIFPHLSNRHSLGDFKRNKKDDMSMFTQTTTERVDQLGPLSPTHKHKTHKIHKHTKYKHTAQSHTATWWSPEIGTKSSPAIALMVVATLGEQFNQKTCAQSKGDKSTEHNKF